MELEKRLNALQGEKEGLSCTLDESEDRIVMLEKQTREQEHIVRPFAVIHSPAIEQCTGPTGTVGARLHSHVDLTYHPHTVRQSSVVGV